MKIKTWNGNAINDGTNYEAIEGESFYGIQGIGVKSVPRPGKWPLVGGITRGERMLYFDVYIRAMASRTTLQSQLAEWFDPDDETPKKLIVTDADGTTNQRYVYAICKELREVQFSAGLQYVVGLQIHGDPLWRENTATTSTWSITATGQTKLLTNNGKDQAYPLLKIKPTSGKTGSYNYKRWIAVRWNVSGVGYTRYPTDICNDGFDTAALVTAFKMQSDGDDLRVMVDGVEVDRWLDGINTTTTKVWVNLNFSAKQEFTLKTAIAASGVVSTIDVNEDTSGLPSSGIVMIGSEAFTFTGKVNASKRLTGCTRAMRGTSMAAHAIGDVVWWVQHDIWILYGNSTATAPTVNSDLEPAFELDHSTNTSWVYEEFMNELGIGSPTGTRQQRTGAWTYGIEAKSGSNVDIDFYGGNRGAMADPWVEIGIDIQNYWLGHAVGYLQVYNPCFITNANFANGEKYSGDLGAAWSAYIKSGASGWATSVVEDVIAEPSTVSTWEAWSDNEAITASSPYVRLYMDITGYSGMSTIKKFYLEAADCTLTLNSSYTPTVSIGSEQSNYSLACKITNNTTGLAINLAFVMGLNEELQIDTYNKTITYLADNSSQFQALTIEGATRRDWLALNPGNNTLQFDDTGTVGVTITLSWEERHYH